MALKRCRSDEAKIKSGFNQHIHRFTRCAERAAKRPVHSEAARFSVKITKIGDSCLHTKITLNTLSILFLLVHILP